MSASNTQKEQNQAGSIDFAREQTEAGAPEPWNGMSEMAFERQPTKKTGCCNHRRLPVIADGEFYDPEES